MTSVTCIVWDTTTVSYGLGEGVASPADGRDIILLGYLCSPAFGVIAVLEHVDIRTAPAVRDSHRFESQKTFMQHTANVEDGVKG